ncbi:MAG TPA: hypothetical protein VGA56_06455 [Opitutaceae bacterium]
MKAETDIRGALREWVLKTSTKITAGELKDDMPIIEERIITSLQIMDLILFLEQLTGRSIDVAQLRPGVFRSIDAIYKNFFEDGSDER